MTRRSNIPADVIVRVDQVRPDGQRRLYALRQEPFAELETWLAGYRALWEARLDRFGAALEARRQTHDMGKKDPSP